MKVVKTSSFIDQVVTNTTTNKNRNGVIANLVQNRKEDDIANRIASTWDELQKQRTTARIQAVRSGVPAEEMSAKPEHMLSFVQQIMNSCAWSARKVLQSGQKTDLANGLDFSQDVAAQAGDIESARRQDVECALMDDFAKLNELHSWLCSNMSYMTDLDPLFLFAEKECVDEIAQVYEHTHMIMDFDELLTVLDDKAEELASQNAQKTTEYAATHVFGAEQSNGKTQLKPLKKTKKAA